METHTIADEFLETKPELLDAIKSFERRRGLSLLRNLQEQENTINFFSTLAEIRTGLFFDPLCSELRYNFPLDGKRPDWYLTLNGQHILCEVLRLNTPEEECEANIERNRELRRFQIENPGVPILEYGEAKSIDTAFLCGAQSKLQFKEAKYRNIIERHQLPFFICVNPSVETYINEIDLTDFLMGRHGFFATDEYFRRYVTGVLLQGYFTGQWVYFPNEKAQFALTEENERVIEEWLL
ncbi:hypothetical protein [Longitalea luteola]|uniref:hypothetical protein n=1 Tax=Longitalea luteola TaxID=2812563 RepID=UPI001A96B4FE|nr:hypothetical protein [Longitalea luteola]